MTTSLKLFSLAPWPLQRPLPTVLRAVLAVYEHVVGQIEFPALMYCPRQNWLAPEREEEWRQFSMGVVFQEGRERPGVGNSAKHICIRGPAYVGWGGPSRAYQYFTMRELEDTEAAMQAVMQPAHMAPAVARWPGGNLLQMLNEVRAVYRRIGQRLD